MKNLSSVRVAFVAGTLGKGGAEKQLFYMVRSLIEAGVQVRVWHVMKAGFYEPHLRAIGARTAWIGRHRGPLLRTLSLASRSRAFRPHIVQASHFYVNLYTSVLGRLTGATAIGSSRSDIHCELELSPRWGRRLLFTPPTLLTNSLAAYQNAQALGVEESRLDLLPNVIDLPAFDALLVGPKTPRMDGDPCVAMMVGSLSAVKRCDRFLEALAQARKRDPGLRGRVVGEGPERAALERQAEAWGLLPGGVEFLGERHDVPALLSHADMLVLSSAHEGFPNVLLEAMAARLPAITTPAGDAPHVVQNGITGFVVPHEDPSIMADRMVSLAGSASLRHRMGEAARKRVEQDYSVESLRESLLAVYSRAASRQGRPALAGRLNQI